MLNLVNKPSPCKTSAPRCPRTLAGSLDVPKKAGLEKISQIFVTYLPREFRRTSTHLGCHEGKRENRRLTVVSSADLAARAVGRRGLPAGDGRGGKGGSANGAKRASGAGDPLHFWLKFC